MYPSCLQTDTSTLVVERELILRSSADAGGGDLIIAGRASADNGGAERKCGVHVTQAVDARREGVVGAEARCLRGGRGGGSRGLTQRMPAEVRPTQLSSETWGGGLWLRTAIHLHASHTQVTVRNFDATVWRHKEAIALIERSLLGSYPVPQNCGRKFRQRKMYANLSDVIGPEIISRKRRLNAREGEENQLA